MILSADQLKALGQGEAVPLKVGDEECVALQKQAFDRLKSNYYDDSELDGREMEPLLANLAAEDWEGASNYKQP